ncbi:hypothetical protein KR51_00019190 [Rubidibacter lacunae KORDI 51-2]|uniref:Uncharacterized protein n=1 Tax=Rubidibacter lacunae KORDI 51-2 TaxID=582515 RepID=U5DKA7_9CHRO|nr:hypothetical protein KR51_00019190 [Rubidibacter lacunae KORDI 51-2]
MVASVVSRFSVVGFSGSRRLPSGARCALSAAAAAVAPDARVLVGCAAGVDAFFRARFPAAEVFEVASGCWGRGRGAFAARSVAVVRAVAAGGGLWVSFPASACPAGLLPSAASRRCFCGAGSGTWASLAFALGSGVPALVFLGSLPVPAGWGLSPVPGCPGWVGSPAAVGAAPVAAQLGLFG